MSGNTATLQIEIKVGGDGTVQLGQINKALDQVDESARKAASGLDSAGKSGDGMVSALKAFIALEATQKLIEWGKESIHIADEMSVLSAKVDLVTSSEAEHIAVQQQLAAQSQITGTAINNNTNAYTSLMLSMREQGGTSQEILAITDMVNKSLKVSGATTAEASSFILQFKQALGSGVLQGDEFRAMMESNSYFGGELAKVLDTDIAGLRAMSSAGELTTSKLREVFPQMAEGINASFEKVPITVDAAMQQVENAFAMVIADANSATGGTNSLAEQISALAVTVHNNAPAIKELFTDIIKLAEMSVRGVSALVGTFDTVASGATSTAAYVAEKLAVATDYYGITANATEGWKLSIDAAKESAVDLAGRADDSFKRMSQSTADAKQEQEAYNKEIAGNSAEVLKGIAAQQQRETEHTASMGRMTKAEKEHAKAIDDMYKTIGGEEYYRREAQKALDHVEVLKKAGAEEVQANQYAYAKISDLSAQAWKKGEMAAAEYLDQVKQTMASVTGATEASSAASADAIERAWKLAGAGATQYYDLQEAKLAKQRDEIIAATGDSLKANTWYFNEVKKLSDETGANKVTVKFYADPSPFSADVRRSMAQIDELNSSKATVQVDADTSKFDSKIKKIEGGFGSDTQSTSGLKESIEMLNNTPTLDPFGATRAKYQEMLKVVAVEENKDNLERQQKAIEHEEQTAKKRLDIWQRSYEEQKKLAEDALKAKKQSLEDEVKAVEDASSREKGLRSAYEEIYNDAGVGGSQAFQAKATDLYEHAQELRDKGVQTMLVEQWLEKKLSDLRAEASKNGISGLEGYISSLESSYAATGNFSDKTVETNEKLHALNKSLEDIEKNGVEAFFSSGAAAAKTFGDQIVNLKRYIEELGDKKYPISFGIERDTEIIDKYKKTGTIEATPTGYRAFSGGGYTGDAPRSGGVDGMGGYYAILHPQETVIDHYAGQNANDSSLYAAKPGSGDGGTMIKIDQIIIQKATDVDSLLAEIKRRALR